MGYRSDSIAVSRDMGPLRPCDVFGGGTLYTARPPKPVLEGSESGVWSVPVPSKENNRGGIVWWVGVTKTVFGEGFYGTFSPPLSFPPPLFFSDLDWDTHTHTPTRARAASGVCGRSVPCAGAIIWLRLEKANKQRPTCQNELVLLYLCLRVCSCVFFQTKHLGFEGEASANNPQHPGTTREVLEGICPWFVALRFCP